jgi:uncharacterized membrane-anchored protein
MFYYEGIAKLDKRTKNLVKRLSPGDIAIIDHQDLDRLTAESLIEAKPVVVVNAAKFCSGKYPNLGPLLLSSAGIFLIDNVGSEVFDKISEGDQLIIKDNCLFSNGSLIARGTELSKEELEIKYREADKRIGKAIEDFTLNTVEFIKREKDLILKGTKLPRIKTCFQKRHALVVVRGYDYKQDLRTLRAYIKEMRPVLIGVDGGADALLSERLKPDIIIGDMDSVSDEALKSGAELIVHAYPNGRAPGLSRIEALGLKAELFEAVGTSEDIALLLAYEKGAELIVVVGSHANLIEFLDKGRAGMSSTFLVRLKVGHKLVDAKGVNKLYRHKVKISHLFLIIAAALTAIIATILASPTIRQLLKLIVLRIRLALGI